jgi:hypothetical protein
MTTIGKFSEAFEETGNYHISFIQKPTIPTPLSSPGATDVSMSSGIPKFNAYAGAPLQSTALEGVGNNGIFLGANTPVGKSKKLLTARLRVVNGAGNAGTPGCTFILADYLMFYPLIDLDDTEEQFFDNTIDIPRYSDGEGLRCFLVSSIPTSLASTATLDYLDADDNVQSVQFTIRVANFTEIISGLGNRPDFFISLPSDRGIKRALKIKVDSPAGGFATLVICKPLGTIVCPEQNVDSELTFINDKLTIPPIKDGAYLNLLMTTTVTATVQVYGEMLFVNI